MKKLTASIIIMCLMAGVSSAYQFQITQSRDADGYCIDWTDISAFVTFQLDTEGEKTIFTTLPDCNSLEDDALQEWFVDAEDVEEAGTERSHLVSFTLGDVGLDFKKNQRFLQYWFRYSLDGTVWSKSNDKIVVRPRRPVAK